MEVQQRDWGDVGAQGGGGAGLGSKGAGKAGGCGSVESRFVCGCGVGSGLPGVADPAWWGC